MKRKEGRAVRKKKDRVARGEVVYDQNKIGDVLVWAALMAKIDSPGAESSKFVKYRAGLRRTLKEAGVHFVAEAEAKA